MKFSTSLILAVLPFLTSVAASPTRGGTLVARQGQQNRQGGGRGGNNNNNGNGQGAGNGNNNAGNGQNGQNGNNGQNGGNGQNGNNGQNGGNGNAGNGNAGNGNAGAGDPQTSLTLDPKVIAAGFAQDGQAVPVDGQVSSLTSTNNFINFCLTVNAPITDGKQLTEGSCNPAPIGVIPAVNRQPSAKFVNPPNGATIPANQQFNAQLAVKNLITGNFVNAQTNYFAAPQQLQGGTIVGHTHVVIEKLAALDSTEPLDPQKFQFFKGVNGAAQNGVVSADVTAGVPAGAYRMCSINTNANHTPVIGPVAQHGSFDDCVYFTATEGGAAAGGGNNNNAGAGAGAGNNAGNGNNAGAGNNAGNGNNAGAGAGQGAGNNAGAGAGQGAGNNAGAGAGQGAGNNAGNGQNAGNGTAGAGNNAGQGAGNNAGNGQNAGAGTVPANQGANTGRGRGRGAFGRGRGRRN